MLFFFQADVESGAELFQRLWPEARVVSDPDKTFYSAFGLQRGSLGQVLGPIVMAAFMSSMARGNMPGKPVGDPFLMPGAFVVEGDRILARHRFRHAGDHPDYVEFVRPFKGASGAEAAPTT